MKKINNLFILSILIIGLANCTEPPTAPPINPPTVLTKEADAVTATKAVLNGVVDGKGSVTFVVFEYGLSTNYGITVTSIPSTVTNNTNVSTDLEKLIPGTTYHFRVKATSTILVIGNDVTFTTLSLHQLQVGDYYEGGIIAKLKSTNQPGLVSAPQDLPRANWKDAIKNCENLVLNGFNDWSLPDSAQIEQVFLVREKISGFVPSTFWDDNYWTSTLPNDSDSTKWAIVKGWFTAPSSPTAIVLGLKIQEHNVRAIRSF